MVKFSMNWASVSGLILVLWVPLVAICSLETFSRKASPRALLLLTIGRLISGYLCAGILFYQGWKLEPIIQFGVFLLVLGIIAESSYSTTRDQVTLWGYDKRFKKEIGWGITQGKKLPRKRLWLWYGLMIAGGVIPLGWIFIAVLAYYNFRKAEQALIALRRDYVEIRPDC